MAMAGAKFKMVKFDGTRNFKLWQMRGKDLLAQQRILKALRPQKLASLDDEDWEELHQRVQQEPYADEKCDDSSKSANVVQNDDSDCSDGDMSGNSSFVYLGDDRCCNIVGVGDVRIKIYDGTARTLSDVRHIPDLKRNLISLGTLHKNGFIPKADEDRETIRIVKSALTVMKGKITTGNIYKLLGSTVVGGVHSVDSCDDNTKLWHMRLGHLSERGMTELQKRNLLHGVKSCKLDFRILDYMHSDMWGPTKEQSLGGSLYYVTFTDNFSRKVWVYFLKQKSEVFAKFKLWKVEVENQTGRKIKYLRSDNGTKYTDSQFQKFCEEHGVQRHFSVRNTPQQNGVAERMNTSLTERARWLRLNAGLPKSFWAEAMELEQHPLAIEKCGRSHPTSGDPVAIEIGGSSTTNELQPYNLARDRQRCTNVKPPIRLGYEDMVSFVLLVTGDEPTTFHGAITSHEKKEKKPTVSEKEGETFKGLLVTKGYSKQKGVEYDEIFSPVVRHTSIRTVLALVASWDLDLEQMDVKTTFLHGDLEEQIYMEQPDGFTQPRHEHLVCKLKKLLYGLKQCPRQWYKQFDSYVLQIDYKRDRGSRKLWLSQRGYVEKVLDRFKPSKAKSVSTPLENHFKLSIEQCPKTNHEVEDMAKVPYASAVGRHHWETVKWIFRYLKGTIGHGVVFGNQQNDPLVVGYVDSYYTADLDDRRSTIGYVFTLREGPICWKSIVQSIVALSTTKAEYMAIAEAPKEAFSLAGYQRTLVLSKVEFSCTVTVKVQFIWLRTRCIMLEQNTLVWDIARLES
ncbi:Retrovirus-related Pol polyprotein from transposon TNT 1-94 [Sesamum angolense]|uniref:Retrovirus-related Pol polyprotein from transposon TNT 1-94 n=1 Tax=Sesamum angolense TaxID=2727404 RepID=A0AAE1W3H3_9LAMI|nr:Retrovirus-related Pol polyprotein from transposon TNT 1-94 [Sesamum angolense]